MQTDDLSLLAADTVRMLAVDGVQKANSGHPGMPMGMADVAVVLWTRFLRFNPEDPDWLNRDRFVLSAGHGSMLLYSLLYLSGYDVTLEDLRSFRQWGSRTPGHPEYRCLPGVETTTGPLGQGFGNGVGMAVAAKMMAARFNSPDFPIFTSRIFAIVSDGDIMEGVAAESASLAGHWRLGNLVYLYDDNRITIEGETRLAFSEDVLARFAAYGWHTLQVDGHDHQAIGRAIQEGIEEKKHPTLIPARTHIACGSPNKQDSESSHGSPLGEEEVAATKANLGWPTRPSFYVPEEVKQFFHRCVDKRKREYRRWQKTYHAWQETYPHLADQLDKMLRKEVPDTFESRLMAGIPKKEMATRASSGKILQIAARHVPGLCGGSADLAPSTKTLIEEAESIAAEKFVGRNFHFGIREHGMGAILNGISEFGGFIPFGATFLVFSDYMRPSIRLAALMGLQVIYVFTHDSIFLGEDGPTHQPVEQLAALRAIPNLTVIRPADRLEVVLSWGYAIRRTDGPTALILTRQTVPDLNERAQKPDLRGYVVARERSGNPDVILAASGSEVHVALEAKHLLEQNHFEVRVISLPSLELFKNRPADLRTQLIPENTTPVVLIEAGVSQSWEGITEGPKLIISLERFGESAPSKILAEQFGFTGEKVAEKVLAWVKPILVSNESNKAYK